MPSTVPLCRRHYALSKNLDASYAGRSSSCLIYLSLLFKTSLMTSLSPPVSFVRVLRLIRLGRERPAASGPLFQQLPHLALRRLKDAAAIAEVPEAIVRKTIEAKTISPTHMTAGRVRRCRFAAHDLLYLKVLAAFPLPLPRGDKQALCDIIEGKQASSGRWYWGNGVLVTRSEGVEVRVDLRDLGQALVDRLRIFHYGRRRISSSPDVLSGEPVFAGTRIPLSNITALFAKKVPIDEIKEDYPALSADELRYAALVAGMKPNPGRPRKHLTFLREGHSVRTGD